jgi:hypothetical protein
MTLALAVAAAVADTARRILRRPECPLCCCRIPRGVDYCPSHHDLEIAQFEESR